MTSLIPCSFTIWVGCHLLYGRPVSAIPAGEWGGVPNGLLVIPVRDASVVLSWCSVSWIWILFPFPLWPSSEGKLREDTSSFFHLASSPTDLVGRTLQAAWPQTPMVPHCSNPQLHPLLLTMWSLLSDHIWGGKDCLKKKKTKKHLVFLSRISWSIANFF